jgi:hypothetical protein
MKEVQFTLTLEDLLAFHRYHHGDLKTQLRRHWKLLTLCVMLYALACTLWAAVSEEEAFYAVTITYFAGGLALLALVFVGYALTRALTSIQLRWMYRRGDLRRDLHQQHLTITRDSLTTCDELSTSTTHWKAVEKVAATHSHLFIYLDKWMALVVPRHAFATDEAFQEFVAAAESFHRATIAR